MMSMSNYTQHEQFVERDLCVVCYTHKQQQQQQKTLFLYYNNILITSKNTRFEYFKKDAMKTESENEIAYQNKTFDAILYTVYSLLIKY